MTSPVEISGIGHNNLTCSQHGCMTWDNDLDLGKGLLVPGANYHLISLGSLMSQGVQFDGNPTLQRDLGDGSKQSYQSDQLRWSSWILLLYDYKTGLIRMGMVLQLTFLGRGNLPPTLRIFRKILR